MASIVQIVDYFRAGYGAIVINTVEEVRVIKEIERLASEQGARLWVCSTTEGMIRLAGSGNGASGVERIEKFDVIEILDTIIARASEEREWFILLDVDEFANNNPQVTRRIRDLCHRLQSMNQRVLFVQPQWRLPAKLEREVTLIDIELPSRAELLAVVNRMAETYQEAIDVKRSKGMAVDPYNMPENGEKELIVEAMVGMTILEAENSCSLAFQKTRSFDKAMITQEKMQIVKKSGVAELYPSVEGLNRIGGHDVLKKWLRVRRRAFDHSAREYGLKTPKGVIMVGPPGTGKSLTCKCIGAEWGIPILRVDSGALMQGEVGASERNTRQMIHTADAIGRCELWLDEIDKGLATPTGKVLSGGDVTKRVMGTLVTWMSEKETPVFIAATCNDVQSIPPEMIRAGRFDKFFFVDLPTAAERAEIVSILLGKVKRDPAKFDCGQIAYESDGYTGAELERAVDEAMNIAFDKSKEVNTGDVIAALRTMAPISRTQSEEIERLRTWAEGKATWSSSRDGKGGVGSARNVEV